MPSIAFIMQSFYGDHIGGAERQVQMLGEALRGVGWKTFYLGERPANKPIKEHLEGMEVYALPERKKRWTWRNYGLLKSAMTDCRAELFYQRVRHPYTGLGALAAKALSKPFIWAAASTADTIRKKDLRQTTYATGPLDKFLHPLNRKLEDWGVRHADRIILQTEEQRRLLEENYHRTGVVIPNHIRSQTNAEVDKHHPPEILWISNVKPFKRPELFLRLADKLQDLPVRFVMAGDCPNPTILAQIQAAQDRLANFTYLGPLPPLQAEQRIAASTLLVNTSLFEGFPNAFQQAWCYGVPTLSLGVDPDGLMQREEMGICAVSIEDLERQLRRLILNSDMIIQMGQKARVFARQFDLANLLPKYISLFESLLPA